MKKEYRFRFANKSKKTVCPNCGKKEFTRYFDYKKEEFLPEEYGICSRLNKCGYHLNPYKDGFVARLYEQESNGRKETASDFLKRIRTQHKKAIDKPQEQPKKTLTSVPLQLFTESLQGLDKSNFTLFLDKVFGAKKATEIVAKYYIGAKPGFRFKNRDFPGYASPEGACIFWRISYEGRPHSGKVMLYDAETGKRIKEPFNHVNWVHVLHKLDTENPMKHFFGEHFLKLFPGKPVMIHESEKTACIASGYLPEYIHLACGGLAMLTPDRCEILKGRQVVLCPDLDGFEKWKLKAEELGFGLFTIHHKKAVQAGIKGAKFDLADFLLNIPYPKEEQLSVSPAIVVPEAEEQLPEYLSEHRTEEGFTLAKIRFPNNELKKVLFDADGEPVNMAASPDQLRRLFLLFGSCFKEGLICGLPALLAPCREEEEPGLNWEPILAGLKALPLFRHKLTFPDGRQLQEPSRRVQEIIHSIRHGSNSVELFEEALFILQSVQKGPYLITSHKEKEYLSLISKEFFTQEMSTYHSLKLYQPQ